MLSSSKVFCFFDGECTSSKGSGRAFRLRLISRRRLAGSTRLVLVRLVVDADLVGEVVGAAAKPARDTASGYKMVGI